MAIAYRPEIDGLRAIAVSSVVLYHAGIGNAGFVGVDVFFVISGYLITSLLLGEREVSGRIDLLAFYARRVKRIFPAALACVSLVLAAAPLFLAPAELLRTAHSASAAAMFASNCYFQLSTGGYFDSGVERMPLLHLWSLSVEEQFYLAWPAIVMLVPRRRLLASLCVLVLLSFALTEVWMRSYPQAAFYQMPARAWELAIGGIVACLPTRAPPRWCIPAGLLVVLAACAFPFGDFPGTGALPAVLGSALLIFAVHGGGTNNLLSSRLPVGLGKISFSLYLWHWPLLAFYRAMTIGAPDQSVLLALCVAAIVLAVLSYRFVETPFRRMRIEPRHWVRSGSAVALVLAVSAAALASTTGAVVAPEGSREAMARRAERDVLPEFAAQPHARVVVWGDSFATTWQPLGFALARARNTGARLEMLHGCPPLLGFKVRDFAHTVDPAACLGHNARSARFAMAADTVVLALNWQRYTGAGDDASVAKGLRSTLEALRGVPRVLVVAPTPVMPDEIPRCIRSGIDCGVSRVGFELQSRPSRELLDEARKGMANVSIVDPVSYLCSLSRCPGVKDGIALYTDDHHVSGTAANAFAERWARTLPPVSASSEPSVSSRIAPRFHTGRHSS